MERRGPEGKWRGKLSLWLPPYGHPRLITHHLQAPSGLQQVSTPTFLALLTGFRLLVC